MYYGTDFIFYVYFLEFAHELKQLSNSEHALNFLFDLVENNIKNMDF